MSVLKNKSGISGVIILVGMLLVLALGGAAYFIINNADGNEDSPTQAVVDKNDSTETTAEEIDDTKNQSNVDDRDTERLNDINALFTGLEFFYAENGYYPERSLQSVLETVEQEEFADPNGVLIQTNGSEYSYEPVGCDENNGKCTSFVLKAQLSDGTIFEKRSLNE